ncbi:MAG: HAD family phosphatase [Acidimicrobiia bacterium]
MLFDFDGVIADTEPLSWAAWREVMAASGYQIVAEDVAACTGTNSRDTYAHFSAKVRLPPFREVVEAVDELRHRSYETDLFAYPDAVATIGELSMVGVPMAVATSSSRRNLDRKLEVLELAGFFAATVAGDEVPRGKPAPDLYAAAVEAVGARARDCLAVEDSEIGADAASAAGVPVMVVDRGLVTVTRYPVVPRIEADLVLRLLGLT